MSYSFTEDLLERTAEWRTRLGQNMLYVNLLGPGVTIDDYKKYLSAIYGFVSGFEQYIFPELTQFIPDIETRRKTKLVADDLIALGHDINEAEPLPESYFRSMYTDPYAALGALYVLESSTLGGHIIQEHLQTSLEKKTVNKLNYFVANGERAETVWQRFLKMFSNTGESTDKKENIIDGALRTYRLLDQLMTDESLKPA